MANLVSYLDGTQRSTKFGVDTKVNGNGPSGRTNFLPSHRSLGKLVGKLLPKPFDWLFEEAVRRRILNKVASDDNEPKVGATPLIWLTQSFEEIWPTRRTHCPPSVSEEHEVEGCWTSLTGSLNRMNNVTTIDCLDVFLLEVTLNRTLQPTKPLKDSALNASMVRHVRAYSKLDLDTVSDWKYIAYLVVIPKAGIFYCHRETLEAGLLEGTVDHGGYPMAHSGPGHLPIGLSWLRLKRKTGHPARNGYAKAIHRCWHFKGPLHDGAAISESPHYARDDRPAPSFVSKKVIHAIQVADSEGPVLPPDIFSLNPEIKTSSMSTEELKGAYNELRRNSSSTRIGAKHYVQGSKHSDLSRFPDVLIIDPLLHGNIDINVGVQDSYTVVDIVDDGGNTRNRNSANGIPGNSVEKVLEEINKCTMQEESIIEIRFVGKTDESKLLLDNIGQASRDITLTSLKNNGGKSQVRSKSGDGGYMTPVGVAFVQTLSMENWEYITTKQVPAKNLKTAAKSGGILGKAYFPSTLKAMQDIERDSGIPFPECLYDPHGDPDIMDEVFPEANEVSSSLVVSCNLKNASHYDVWDSGKGYCIFTKKDRDRKVTNWYFILPNMIGRRADGTIFQGIAIRLHHGVAIAWDGRIIRHCTSVTRGVAKPVDTNADGDPQVYAMYFGGKVPLIANSRRKLQQALHERTAALQETATPTSKNSSSKRNKRKKRERHTNSQLF